MLIVLAVEGTIAGAGAEETGAPTGCGEYSFGFAGTRLVNDGISDSAGPYTIELPAGTYDVTLVGADDHSMSDQSDQTGEQWYVALDNGWQSTLTDDLPDDADMITTSITGQQLDAATAISVHHAGEGNVNSIDVVCVGFTSASADTDAMDPAEGDAEDDASDPAEGDEMTDDAPDETDPAEGDAEDDASDPAEGDAEDDASNPAEADEMTDDAPDETDPAEGDAVEAVDDDATDVVEGDEASEASAPEDAEADDSSEEQAADEEGVDASETGDDEVAKDDVEIDADVEESAATAEGDDANDAVVSDGAAADEDGVTSTDSGLGSERPESPHEMSRTDDA